MKGGQLRLMATLAACIALLSPGTASGASPWGADYFPNVTLLTQDGTKVRFYDDLLKGKNVAINLVYTSCQNICPLETAKLVEVQRLLGARMGRDIFFYSIAIDPWDTPKELKAYAQKFGVGPGWLFLSGKEEDIRLITRKLGLSRASDAVNKDGHSPSLMVGNVAAGQWMRNSSVDNPQFLATTISNFFGWRDSPGLRSYAEAGPLSIGKGEFLFQSRCASCHTLGGGDRLGPDLLGVTQRRERSWLLRYVSAPEKVRAEGDAAAAGLAKKYSRVRMPNLGLGEEDVATLWSYLDDRGRSGASKEAGTPAPARAR